MTTKKQNKEMLDAIEGKIKHKCKLCGEKIDCLTSTATSTTGVTMTSKGKIEMDEENLISDAEWGEWRCPECYGLIAMNIDEAEKFFGLK